MLQERGGNHSKLQLTEKFTYLNHHPLIITIHSVEEMIPLPFNPSISTGCKFFFIGGPSWVYTLFYKQCFFSAQAQMLLNEMQNSLNLTLPYPIKRCLKYYLGREQSFDEVSECTIFSEIGKFQPSVAYKACILFLQGILGCNIFIGDPGFIIF